jgi:type I restriction enzyme S subunit
LIPSCWSSTKIQDILLEYQNGYAFSAKGYVKHGIPIVSMAMISLKGRFKFDDNKCKYWDSKEEDSLSRYLLQKGDLIIAMTDVTPNKDLIGKMAVIDIDGKFLLNQRVGHLKLNKELINVSYLSYIGNSENWLKNCRNIASQGAQANLGTKQILESYIPLPPLLEQQKIAEILSTVDAKIEVIDQQITETQELKKGLMQSMLTKGIGHTKFKDSPFGEIPKIWEVKLLDECAIRASGHTPNKKEDSYYNGGIKWVSLGDSKRLDKRYISKTKIEISEEGIKNSSAVLHPKGTVLMSRDAGVGKSAVMKTEMAVSQHFIVWKCDDNFNNWFLYYTLQQLKPLFERVAVGSTIKTIGLGFFKKLKIAVPSIEEQNKISKILNLTDDKLDILLEKKETYRELKKGLMQQLLTGLVRVKV